MSENQNPVLDEATIHDLVAGNLAAIVQFHVKRSAQEALPPVLMKSLLGKVDEASLMKALNEMAETMSMIQDMMEIFLDFVGLTHERVAEIDKLDLTTEYVRDVTSAHPVYGPLLERAREAQMLSSKEKLNRAMASTDPEVIFRNMGMDGFKL